MKFHSSQEPASIARIGLYIITSIFAFAMSPQALSQQVLTPPTISFGNVPLTVPVTQTGTFTNNSTFQTVTITGISTSDPRFVAAGSGATPCNVGTLVSFGASCTYSLTFTPTGNGAFNNTTSVAYDLVTTPQTPLTQPANGTGITPPSTASPSSVLFGNVPLTVVANQPFTFTNNSNTTSFPASYTLTSFSTTGLGFSAVGSGATPCAVGLVLPPSASCQATASFQIGGAGSSNGTTTIGFQTGQGANPVYNTSVALNGNGFIPPSTVSPPSLGFGNVPVGSPATQSFTFTNNSDTTTYPSTYTLTGFSTSGLGYSAVGSGGNPCTVNLMLAAGASCGMTVTFTPAGAGASGGSTTINFLAGLGSDPPYSKTVSLSGNGVVVPTATIAQTGSPSMTVVPGLPVNMNVTVSGGAGTPTGSITVKLRNLSTMVVSDINGGVCLMAGLTSGSFNCPYTAPAAGNYSIEISYSGDGTYPSSFATFALTTAQAVPAIAQSGSPATAVPGQAVSMMLNVTSSSPLGPPTGIVTVKLRNLSTMVVTDINAGVCLMAGLSSGSFTCPYTTPAAGNYQIEVSYSGDTPNAPALGTFALTTAQAVPVVNQTGSPATATPGQAVSMMLSVTSSSPLGPPTGIVTVKLRNLSTMVVGDINGGVCLMAGLTSGLFTCPYTAPAVGNYQIEVSYSGDTPNAPATANFALTVAAAPTPTMTVAFAPGSVATGVNSTLTVTIINPAGASASIGLGSLVNVPGLTMSGLTDSCSLAAFISGATIDFGMTGVLPAMSTCTVTVQAQSAMTGTFPVTVMPGNLITSQGNNANTSTSTLTVTTAPPPTMTVAFAPASVNTGVNATMTLTLTNPNASPATMSIGSLVSVPGLIMSGLVDGCGASASISTGSIDLGMGGSIPAMGSCTISVQTQSSTAGSFPVTVSPGNLITSQGNNTNSSTSTLTVTAVATGPFGYIANFGSFSGNTVSVIDLPTNTVATTLTVGTGPVGVTVNYAGTRAYVSNQQSNSVSVINTATNTIIATVPVGSQPGELGVNPAGTRLYAPNQTGNSVTVIDATTNTVITTVGGIAFPVAVAVNPTGSKAYVTSNSANVLSVIDTTSNTVIGTVPVCSAPYSLRFNPSGTRIYAQCTSGVISVIDATTGSPITTIAVGSNSRGLAMSPAGTILYATNTGANNISVIDTSTNMVVNTLTAGAGPNGVSISADGTRLYVINSNSNNVTVFDTGTNGVIATIPVGANPFGAAPFVQPAGFTPTPAVSLAPPSVAFGARTVNTTSPASVVTLTNSGTANLIISGISGSGDFAFTTTCPISTPPIAAAGSCTISITFTPLTVAALSGGITITSNAPGSPHIIALSGTGSAVPVPGVGLSTTLLNLGNQPVNTTSAVQSIALTNTGFATLLISGISQMGSGAFTRVSPASPAPDCATSLAPAATCYISVSFTPTALGTATAQISIASNALGSPSIINLTGTGISAAIPAISVPARLPFGDQVINESGTQVLNIFSSGTAPLSISTVSLAGADAGSFAISGNCGFVSAGASCPISITFTPTNVGAKTADLVINSDAAGLTSVIVQLVGNGILAPRPILSLTTTIMGFGNAIIGGATASQLVTLRNDGGAPMQVLGLYTVGDFAQMHSCPAMLGSGAACLINVLFTPLASGARTGELVLVSNAEANPRRIPLSGNGCRWFSQGQGRLFVTLCGN